MTNSSTPEPVDLSDPSISPHRLQELAQTHPEQWDEILAHPNVYQGLADWIRDRQAELAATGDEDPAVAPELAAQEDAEAQQEVDEAAALSAEESDSLPSAEGSFEGSSVSESDDTQEAQDTPAAEASAGQTDSFKPAESPETTVLPETTGQSEPSEEPAEQTPWAMPDASQPDSSQPEQQSTSPTTGAGSTSWSAQSEQTSTQAEQAPHEQQAWGWSQPSGQQFGQPQQQPSGQQQQFGAPQYGYGQAYGQPQQSGQAQQFAPRQVGYTQPPATSRSGSSRIDLSSARTWGLFVAGGAAFLSLFGFLFAPGLDAGRVFTTHLSAGGWVILLLLIATVALSLLQLLKPSAWMRFFFIAASLGAAFMMLGRTMTLVSYLTMQFTSFSTLWLLFMALVMLAGALMFLAPKASDGEQPNSTRSMSTAQPGQYGTPYGQQPQPGQQTTNYPQQPGGPQQPYGGYSPGGPQQ